MNIHLKNLLAYHSETNPIERVFSILKNEINLNVIIDKNSE